MATMAKVSEILTDTAISFGFEFNSSQWMVVVRRKAKFCGVITRVDIIEDGEVVGIGYLPDPVGGCPVEDGPMFDAYYDTPIRGKSLCSSESIEQGAPEPSPELVSQWAEIVHYHWNLVASAYRKSISEETPHR